MSIWQQILETLGGIAIAATALAWLIKSLVGQWLSKDIEAYKANLSIESSKQIESLKANIQRAGQENSVRFAALHQKRMAVMSDLYALLLETQGKITHYLRATSNSSSHGADDSNIVALQREGLDSANALFDFVIRNQLYFSDELSKSINEMVSGLRDPIALLQRGDIDATDLWTKWPENLERFESARLTIAREFRGFIGSA